MSLVAQQQTAVYTFTVFAHLLVILRNKHVNEPFSQRACAFISTRNSPTYIFLECTVCWSSTHLCFSSSEFISHRAFPELVRGTHEVQPTRGTTRHGHGTWFFSFFQVEDTATEEKSCFVLQHDPVWTSQPREWTWIQAYVASKVGPKDFWAHCSADRQCSVGLAAQLAKCIQSENHGVSR